MKNNVLNQLKSKAIWVVFAVLFIGFALANHRFLSSSNLFTIARQVSMYGIASIGMTFVILIAGIDLSTGSIITIVNIVCAYLMVNSGFSMTAAVICALLMATMIGVINGFLVSSIGMPALIATFATQIIFEGAAYLLSGGTPVYGFDERFKFIGQGYIGPIPVPVIIMIACFAIGSFILNKTYFGRYFYAVGGNEEAARLSGIRVGFIKYLIYALSGLFAGLAGIVMLSRTNSAQPTAGKGYEFDVITCVVLGGVSVSGGYGKMSNVVAGVLIIGILTNGMVLLNVSTYMQMVVKGLVLALAVGFDCLQRKRVVA
ncbi:monosaccharide ABC transporter membrane protein (CUT2 family) [Lachnotalea glycerini]|jgi:ribose transport system permease protein|uniref:ABC transporter permease n=1 Tax=Lachnotalea glycerini TaxID=1763509 RepID=A0A255IRR9_9FIRM|nr:ABC transporter permease [Lachnotalea glycerini]OYO51577.1 ribose ABC transporter permease [Lachnotalea glycerini]PXV87724.1 monosaccharide ABC transporter membrane protein (CUT2 family) [Lachnotalea glycerini]RDY32105.1 ABC transporter permease [Lachnotalea glycerini]